jgi:hypothetical protein
MEGVIEFDFELKQIMVELFALQDMGKHQHLMNSVDSIYTPEYQEKLDNMNNELWEPAPEGKGRRLLGNKSPLQSYKPC